MISKFVDYTRTESPEWYVHIRSESDLEELERIGHWAQEQEQCGVSLYCYNDWRVKNGVGPASFCFRHKSSLEFLADRVRYFRKELDKYDYGCQIASPEIFQLTLEF